MVLPTVDNENARVVVKDNGPGMSFEVLEKAVKAGWSGNSPLENLGLFGMGFNIGPEPGQPNWNKRIGGAARTQRTNQESGVTWGLERLS